MTLALERRAATLRRLAREEFDILVIGGGITGSGIARDAALRGLRTALLERDDFASGTSSRSSRLVHGGVRYLEHGHFHLVFESCRERRTLLRIAPHLVRALPFSWPVYRGARVSRPVLFVGLALYDALALLRNVRRHERLTAREVLDDEPTLRSDGLLGGARYFDASTDDARLTLANVIGAAEAGAAVANYAGVVELIGASGRATGVVAIDAPTGAALWVRARTIVNATGPWTDGLQRLETAAPSPAILGSKGAHIAVPRARIGNRHAVTMLHPADGRVMFALPAGQQTIIGTTETAADAGPAEIRAGRSDISYLLAAANAYFPRGSLGERDIVATWAGIRPLVAGLAMDDAGSASREHAVSVGALGVLSVTGGKLTTYRAMAEGIVDEIVLQHGRPHVQRCRTARVPLPGGDFATVEELRAVAAGVVPVPAVRERLLAAFGTRWRQVWERTAAEPRFATPVSDELPYTGAEFVYATQREMALTLGDLLIRRTPAAFETPDHATALAPRVASIVAPHLGWNAAREREEIQRYDREVERIFGDRESGIGNRNV